MYGGDAKLEEKFRCVLWKWLLRLRNRRLSRGFYHSSTYFLPSSASPTVKQETLTFKGPISAPVSDIYFSC